MPLFEPPSKDELVVELDTVLLLYKAIPEGEPLNPDGFIAGAAYALGWVRGNVASPPSSCVAPDGPLTN